MSLGSLGYVGYAVELTNGDLSAPTIFLPVSAFGFEDSDENIVPKQIRHSRDNSIALPAAYNVSGTMEMELIPQGISALLKNVLCATVNTTPYAGGGYQHVFTPGGTFPNTLAFESSAADILVVRYGGIVVNNMSLKAAFNEIVSSTFALEGISRAKQASPATPTYTGVAHNPFTFSGAGVSFGGTTSTSVSEVQLEIENGVERIGSLRKTRSWRRMDIKERGFKFSLTLDFTDTAEYDRFVAQQYFDVNLNFEGDYVSGTSGALDTLVFDFPKVKWNKVGTPIKAGDFIKQTVEALILAPVGSPVATVTLINNEATA